MDRLLATPEQRRIVFASNSKIGIAMIVFILLLYGGFWYAVQHSPDAPTDFKTFVYYFYFFLVFIMVQHYKKYVLFDDYLKISYAFGIRPPWILVFGRRLNESYSIPFGYIPSLIRYNEIESAHYELSQSNSKYGFRSGVRVKLRNNRNFKLNMETEESQKFVAVLNEKLKKVVQ